MPTYTLKATPSTVHLGGFSSQLAPALRVQSGDVVEVETYSGFAHYGKAPDRFFTPEFIEICKTLPAERRVGSGPHLLTGPIHMEGAEPGDVLEVRLQSITPRLPIGFNAIRPGWGALPGEFDQPRLRFIDLDLEQGVAEFPTGSGIRVPIQPFFGILGVATDETSRNSVPPGAYGGNIDNRQLQAGSRVFLPVFLPGALFSVGDGHAAQGDGEIDVTAIETSMNGTLQLILHKDLHFQVPMAETPTDFITMGFAEDLDAAFELALKRMIDFLHKFVGIEREEAYVLCSIAVNFHITQVVNSPMKGVHGLLPKEILPQPTLL
ncbi:MAG: acetamidase/formamidase family protein [Thermostichus sp. DG02_5_bins_236]